MNIKKWLEKNARSLSGRVVAISGATGGIGRELCRHVASLGASLITMDRNSERSLALCKEIEGEFPGISTSHIRLDLSDIESVKRCIEKLKENVPDYIILNAGAYHIPLCECNTGYNNVFSINFVSPYIICRALCGAVAANGGKIIAIGSIAHGYSIADRNDVDFSTRKKSSLIYGNAKRYLMYGLCELCDGSVAIAHPGITLTNITAHYPKIIFSLIKHPMKIIFMSPKKASLSIIAAMFSDISAHEWVGPRIFGIWGSPKIQRLRKLRDEERNIILGECEKIAKTVKM
ncbi:MAG: SDR family NAD(P)-dependent oxidoreductase [Clostridia bacterium]|nr:SDR family NAD(P)-dependent oxidoreductase [Clostridia bacterium]